MQVSGTDDVKGGMQAVLDCFHDWLEAGAGGTANWSLEPENHEGWRVSIDEGGSTFPASNCIVGVAQSFVHCRSCHSLS